MVGNKTYKIIGSALILVVGIYFLTQNPVVVDRTLQNRENISLSKGDVIKPFENFNFEEGSWKAFIVTSSEDQAKLPREGKVFYSEDISILNKIKKEWVFIYTGADVATIQSKFLLYKDNSLIFSSKIAIDKNNNGLQSINYGWLKSKDSDSFISDCMQFKRGYSPVYYFDN